MEQLMSVAAFVVAAGGLLVILTVLGAPLVHREVVVMRLRRSLHRIDHVLEAWDTDTDTRDRLA